MVTIEVCKVASVDIHLVIAQRSSRHRRHGAAASAVQCTHTSEKNTSCSGVSTFRLLAVVDRGLIG